MSTADDESPPARLGRRARRNQRMAAQIARARSGEHTVPTWVMAAILVALVAGWLVLIFFVR